MSMNDPLANALSAIVTHEQIGRQECVLKTSSKLIKGVLGIMKDNQYIGDCEETENVRGNVLKVNLLGRINKCGVIKPRYSIKKEVYEKFEKRFLPAKDFGIIIVSTPKGLVTHKQAKEQKLGGRLIAYVY